MKTLICIIAAAVLSVTASAAMEYDFTDALGQTASINVEYWTGSGSHETLLVIDWNQTGDYVTPSHAFGYRWDGTATTVQTMLDAIVANGALGLKYIGYVRNLFYDDEFDTHLHNEEGSWNFASTNNVFALWGTVNQDWTMYGQWQANMGNIDTEYIAHGQLEGVNACYYFDQTQPYEFLDVPFSTPEPASLAMLAFGGLFLRRKK